MNTPKVSVIIPVYKAEKFIERCCTGLFGQTLDDMEFIFVDDCSPDNSIDMIRQIVTRYPNRENQVKILTHAPNRGVSFTRQQGLETATGEFVIHCDSDDWIDLDMYETMYNTTISEGADEVCCGYVIEYSNGNRSYVLCDEEKMCSKIQFNIAPEIGSLWNKLVRLSNLRDAKVVFPNDTSWGEDFCISIAGLILSKKTVCLDKCFYHYWQNVESITHTISENRCDELLKVATHVEDFLKKNKLLDEYRFQLNYLKFQVKAPFLKIRDVRNIEKWKMLFPESNKNIISYRYSMYFKVCAILLCNHMGVLARAILYSRDVLNSIRKI